MTGGTEDIDIALGAVDHSVLSDKLPQGTPTREDYYRIRARRDIITEAGFIRAGETGFVTRSWIEAVISNNCSCKGSINWFKILR